MWIFCDVSQFLSSEHVNTYESESVEDAVEKEVVLTVDGQESRIVFLDHPHGARSVESLLTDYIPHAVLVVMAVNEQGPTLEHLRCQVTLIVTRIRHQSIFSLQRSILIQNF